MFEDSKVGQKYTSDSLSREGNIFLGIIANGEKYARREQQFCGVGLKRVGY